MNSNSFHLASALIAGLFLSAVAFAEDKAPSDNNDKLLVAAQKICPVSGQDLHAMGGPIKAKSGDQTVFLCCKGCLGKQISKANWGKVTANLIAAQGHCPVMNKALPQNAKSIVIKNRRVFVCCPSCLAKIQAEPDKYLAVVDQSLAQNVGPREE